MLRENEHLLAPNWMKRSSGDCLTWLGFVHFQLHLGVSKVQLQSLVTDERS